MPISVQKERRCSLTNAFGNRELKKAMSQVEEHHRTTVPVALPIE
jgi:hypothetical protein